MCNIDKWIASRSDFPQDSGSQGFPVCLFVTGLSALSMVLGGIYILKMDLYGSDHISLVQVKEKKIDSIQWDEFDEMFNSSEVKWWQL